MRSLLLFASLALLALLATACAGGSGDDKVPSDALALVGGERIAKAKLGAVLAETQCTYRSQNRTFPDAGSRAYALLRDKAIRLLVEQRVYAQEARELGVDVTAEEIDERLVTDKIVFFHGDEKLYRKALEDQCLTEQFVRDTIEAQLVSERIFEKVTAAVMVSRSEIADHYEAHKSEYRRRASRDVQHILVRSERLAQRLYRELARTGSENFDDLARSFSRDLASRDIGGRLTISKGDTQPAFETAAFALPTKGISAPIRTKFGWHVIHALSPVRPASIAPLKDVEAGIRLQLLHRKREQAFGAWKDAVRKEYAGKVVYQEGFAPSTG